ncbi:hypothetical protein LAJ19_15870 (plasmid) [Deinococcus taeanensis]|uniref:hypothetical protein n=1 Tax=Deinococcus taeanensis TaxID=2737050 RepID=UPI001CDC7326|nr:hypothetical protein [Deinococcus taeanensis]UBV44643.1 hypothetical protein LAJ19_15870 [Deinococcus taeanensis]
MKIILASISLTAVFGAASLFFVQANKKEGLRFSNEQAGLIENDVNVLMKSFEEFRGFAEQATTGDRIDPLKFTPFPCRNSPNWSKPMLLTFGSEYSPNVKLLHKDLSSSEATRDLQFVHIVYPRSWVTSGDPINQEGITSFQSEVSVLNATDDKKAKTFLMRLGIHDGGYVFILDESGIVRYSANDIGLDWKHVSDAVKKYISGTKIEVSDNKIRKIGYQLPLESLSTDIQEALKKRFSSEYNVLVVKSTRECSICGSNMDASIDPILLDLQRRNINVSVVDVNTSSSSIKYDSGILRISDAIENDKPRSAIFDAWNVRGYPSIFIVKDGKYEGEVLYRSWTFTDGKKAEHIQALAASRLVQ